MLDYSWSSIESTSDVGRDEVKSHLNNISSPGAAHASVGPENSSRLGQLLVDLDPAPTKHTTA